MLLNHRPAELECRSEFAELQREAAVYEGDPLDFFAIRHVAKPQVDLPLVERQQAGMSERLGQRLNRNLLVFNCRGERLGVGND